MKIKLLAFKEIREEKTTKKPSNRVQKNKIKNVINSKQNFFGFSRFEGSSCKIHQQTIAHLTCGTFLDLLWIVFVEL
jgi:hypothetical protein